MRNTYNVSLLRRRILDAVPRPMTELGEAAVEAFLALPGASAWRPERLGLRELSFIFDFGVPLAQIGDNPTFKSIALAVGDAARDGHPPDKTVWSVVHAAALLSRWGAAIQFVADGPATVTTKVWRIEARWPDGSTFDVAVRDAAHGDPADIGFPPNEAGDERPRLFAVDVGGTLEDAAAPFDEIFARSPLVAGAFLFQPRFWIGVEQKEWLHLARLNPAAQRPIAADRLGGADGHRRALRLALLV